MAKASKRSGEADFGNTNSKKLKPSMEDMLDSEEDRGRSMSDQILAAAKETAKRRSVAVASFINAVDERDRRLKNLLDDLFLKITEKDNRLRGSLLDVLSKSYPTHPTESKWLEPLAHLSKMDTKPTECRVYNMAKSSIQLSRQLVGHYNRICQQIAAAEGALSMDWGAEGDIQTLQKILQSQGEKAKAEVEQIVDGSSKSAKGLCDINTSAAGDDLWSRFTVPPKEDMKAVRDNGESWAIAAKHIHKGVQRLVKYLPEESEWGLHG